VDLDDAELCERVLPELCAMPILERYDGDEPVYSPRTEAITLRRLMTHTVGQSYGDAAQIRWEKENLPISWRHANAGVESFATPLMCQPGSRFAYGLAIDWVGILVSRVAGQSLEEFFAENIWTPLGLKSFTFLPTEAVRAKLMQCCSRTREGKLIHIGQSEKYGKDPLPHEIIVQSGGGGLYGTMKEYLVFLQNVLRCRDAPGIISPATFRELFSDSLPPADGSHNCQKTLGSFLRMRGYPEKQYTSGAKIGYSPGLCLNLAASENGRKAGSAFWFGAARSEYWMDPATGVIVSRVAAGHSGPLGSSADVKGSVCHPAHERS
jgi:CubicO group peptidase (beta-lactamase class C family)